MSLSRGEVGQKNKPEENIIAHHDMCPEGSDNTVMESNRARKGQSRQSGWEDLPEAVTFNRDPSVV